MKTNDKSSRLQQGFTLIELMIVVAVVGILASIAYPSFAEQIKRGTRTEGKSALMRSSQTLERFFTARGRYPSAAGGGVGQAWALNNAWQSRQ